jgi:hypothetical protein
MRDLYMNIRMGFKFVFWLIRRMFGFGPRGWITGLWYSTRSVFYEGGPEIMLVMIIAPMITFVATFLFSLLWMKPDDGIWPLVYVHLVFWTLWLGSAFLSIKWAEFKREYEQSFTILREYKEQ